MPSSKKLSVVVVLAVLLIACQYAAAQSGKAVMWDPVDIRSRDLYHGPGGRALRPNLRRVTFIRKETGGNNLKYRIRDASGRVWVAKIADESQPEVAAVRLLWGLGYETEVNYIAPIIRIPGRGVYRNASLELRPDGIRREGRWRWDDNPFNGTKEMAGIRIMMAMFNNWDVKDGNNIILQAGGEDRYVISDLGSSFGKPPVSSKFILNRIGRSVNDHQDYVRSEFIKGVVQGEIEFAYKGKGSYLLDGITVEEGRWLADLLTQLSDKQISDAFRAANYNSAQVRAYTRAFRNRIASLDQATRGNIAASRPQSISFR